jgi:hypothetical protein
LDWRDYCDPRIDSTFRRQGIFLRSVIGLGDNVEVPVHKTEKQKSAARPQLRYTLNYPPRS